MSNLQGWFSPGWFRFRASRRDAPLNREPDKVLHGRITKNTSKTLNRLIEHTASDEKASEGAANIKQEDAISFYASTGDTTEEEGQESDPDGTESIRATVEKDEGEDSQDHLTIEQQGQASEDKPSDVQFDQDWRTEDEDSDASEEELSSFIHNLAAPSHETALTSPKYTSGDRADQDDDSESDPESKWRTEQIYLNTILNARNQFTLMPSTWKSSLRGIPLPDSLFYEKTKSKSVRPRIYSRSDTYEYRGVMALRGLIDVHARIQDYRGEQAAVRRDVALTPSKRLQLTRATSSDIVNKLKRALKTALDWANEDGGVAKYGDRLLRNVKIIEMRDKFSADEPDSEEKVQTEMSQLADDWRNLTADVDEEGQSRHQLPVVFGFVILRHIILIVTLDAADPEAIIHIPCQLNMAERNQHQWNALAILVTICWARDVLLDYIESVPEILPESQSDSSDPDI